MTYFAEIDVFSKTVLRVIVCNSKAWCENNLGGTWVNVDDKNYPGKGHMYYEDGDNFSSPQPYPSWSLNSTFKWIPPVPYPDTDETYQWDEETQEWVGFVNSM